MPSVFGIEVIVSDAVRDSEGEPTWRLIPGFSPFLDGDRQGHPFTIEQALSESSFDVRIVCHPEFIEDLLKELNQKAFQSGVEKDDAQKSTNRYCRR